MLHKLTVPISEEAITALHVGDQVHLSGVIVEQRQERGLRAGGAFRAAEAQGLESIFDILQRQFGETDDGCQNIIKIVRNAPSQGPNGLHFLSLSKLGFKHGAVFFNSGQSTSASSTPAV